MNGAILHECAPEKDVCFFTKEDDEMKGEVRRK